MSTTFLQKILIADCSRLLLTKKKIILVVGSTRKQEAT